MIRIGDFSSLTQVSVKTLRFYDENGLLRPVRVDPASGYRYYSASQLPRLHRILALKDLGFSLDQIGAILDGGVSGQELRGMLKLRQAEQQEHVRQENDRLARLQARLRLIEQEENPMSNAEVVIKEVGTQWLVSIRQNIERYQAVGPLFGEVIGTLGPAAMTGVCVAIWHDHEYKEQDVDAEAGMLMPKPVAVSGRVQLRELAGGRMASIIHAGSYQTLPESYNLIAGWITANQYRIAGPIREIYLKSSMPVRQDDESYITEIQFPIERADA